jgi:hypothetical protein
MAASAGNGTRVLAPASGPLPAPPPAGRPVGFAPVFYPGTTLEDQAGIFAVSAGQEMRVSISLQLVPTARLEGTIATADGQPAPMQNLQLSLQRAVSTATPVSQVRMTEPGRFQAVGVPPGRYLLTARVNSQEGRPNGPPGTPQLPPGQWFAQQEIEVTGVDLGGIALTLGPPLSVSGKVVFEGGVPPPDSQIQVRLDAAGRMPVGSYSRSLKPADNGEFTIPGVTPGRYRLNASVFNQTPGPPVAPNPNAPPPWAVKSAIMDGRDALESPVEIQMGRAPQGAVVTLTNRLPQLSASIVDQAGKPVPNMIFVLFSSNREHWIGTNSRRIRTISRPNDDGIYQFNSLLPGEYLLAVLTEIEPNDQFDPNFLEQLVPAAIKITLAEGDRKTQQLRMAK